MSETEDGVACGIAAFADAVGAIRTGRCTDEEIRAFAVRAEDYFSECGELVAMQLCDVLVGEALEASGKRKSGVIGEEQVKADNKYANEITTVAIGIRPHAKHFFPGWETRTCEPGDAEMIGALFADWGRMREERGAGAHWAQRELHDCQCMLDDAGVTPRGGDVLGRLPLLIAERDRLLSELSQIELVIAREKIGGGK